MFALFVACALLIASPPTAAAPICTTGSVGTTGLLAKLEPAATNFQKCHNSVESIASQLKKLKGGMAKARRSADNLERSTEKINDVLEKTKDMTSKTLGKIPKIGIFIKMGINAATQVSNPLQKLARIISRAATKVELAVKITENTFSKTKFITAPVAKLLTGSHKALSAAHKCASAAGYRCASAEGSMERTNQIALARARNDLQAISNTGEVCNKVLNPVDTAITSIAAMVSELDKLAAPIDDILANIKDFMEEIDRLIKDFMDALSQSTAAKCALEIFKPITDAVRVVTCPMDEAANKAFTALINTIMNEVKDLINDATTKLITEGIEALVPDDLRIDIPDFRPNLPTGTWLAMCTAASVAFPEYKYMDQIFNVVKFGFDMTLPYTVTGEQIEQHILGEVLARTQIEPLQVKSYNSACADAFNDIGTHYEACSAASYPRGAGSEPRRRSCKPHFVDFGLTCTRCTSVINCETYFKPTYCSGNMEKVNFFGPRCYEKCRAGYYGVGPVCWINQ